MTMQRKERGFEACGRLALPALVSLVSICASPRAFAYPIAPVTLWELVEKADTIVLAVTERQDTRTSNKLDDDGWNNSVAKLSVTEAWKGHPGARIEVPYPGGMICPAPPRYEVGLPVIAFLEHDKRGRYDTVGLSYGTLYPEPNEVETYKALVKLAVAARSIEDAATRDKARVDWHVRAAIAPATRWHGIYALAPEGDALHAFYDRQPRKPMMLSADQLTALARGFVAAPVMDVTMPMMLKVLAAHRDPAVDETAVAAVDTALAWKQPPFWTVELVTLTSGRLMQKLPPIRRGKDRDELGADPLLGGLDFDVRTLRSRWAIVRKTQAFARRTLDPPPNSGVRGTGPTTPP
jgi:hypothetical protein